MERKEDQNPHYKESRERLFALIAPEKTTGETNIRYLEKKFLLALESENQTLIDQIFHELCGNNDLSPKVRNIKVEFETLSLLASQIRSLNKIVSDQKRQIGLLKDKKKDEKIHHTQESINLINDPSKTANPTQTFSIFCGTSPTFFRKMIDNYIIEHRHEDPDLQREYDKRFGLVTS